MSMASPHPSAVSPLGWGSVRSSLRYAFLLFVPTLPLAAATDVASLPAPAAPAAPAAMDTVVAIEGTVRDALTREVLEGAVVHLSDTPGADPASAATDAEGRFHLSQVRPGRYEFRVTRLGYEEVWDSLTVTDESIIQLEVGMVPQAIELDPLMVRRLPRLAPEMEEFEERRARGIGRFLSRSEIEARGTSQVSDIFRQLPGVTVERTAATRGGGGGHLLMRGSCPPSIYLDGQRAAAGPVDIDAYVSATELEAVEVYSATEAPPQFSHGRCGAVVLWTRPAAMSDEGRAFSWGRLALAAGFVGATLLLNP